MKFYLQSFNDIVTNSSMEVYQEATDYTVNTIKEIIDTILKIAQSDKKCDDLFNITIDYDELYDDYFYRYIENLDKYIEDEFFINEVTKISEENSTKSCKEIYDIFVNKGLIGDDKLISFNQFLDSYGNYNWCSYFNSYVVITPKSEYAKKDAVILNKINNLFYLNAEYNG